MDLIPFLTFIPRYFIVKSCNRENLELSVQQGVWATQRSNEAKLNEAFDSTENVILIFSVNRTRHFQVDFRFSILQNYSICALDLCNSRSLHTTLSILYGQSGSQLSVWGNCKVVYVLSGLCKDDIQNWWVCWWGQLEICTRNCPLWTEFLCQMVKGTISFHLNGTDLCQAFFFPKRFSWFQKFLCCKWWQKPWSWQGFCIPHQMTQVYFNLFCSISLFKSIWVQKFGRVLLEELGFIVVFLEILVTDQCTYFKKLIHVLYKQGASKILCITYDTGAGFFDASNVKENLWDVWTFCICLKLCLKLVWNQRLWGIKLNKLHVLIALCTFLRRTNKKLTFHLQFLICSYVNYPSTKLAI